MNKGQELAKLLALQAGIKLAHINVLQRQLALLTTIGSQMEEALQEIAACIQQLNGGN